jgi:TRAP-type uncharacterized transport system fused permease subunit
MSQELELENTLRESASGQKGRVSGVAYWSVIVLGTIGLLMGINQTFSLRLMGFDPMGNSFLYYLIGIFLAASFLISPATASAKKYVPWYDWIMGLIAIG